MKERKKNRKNEIKKKRKSNVFTDTRQIKSRNYKLIVKSNYLSSLMYLFYSSRFPVNINWPVLLWSSVCTSWRNR